MPVFSVHGKIAIVTGAGSGINYCFAEQLASKGCSVVIADIALRPKSQALIDKYANKDVKVVFSKTDVSDWRQLEAIFPFTESKIGNVDIVCPGAGVFEPLWSNFWTNTEGPSGANSYKTIDININHPIYLTRLAITSFLKAGKPGTIVHISSVAGQLTPLATPIYSATKHAISGFTRSLADLDKEISVRVVGVAPGLIKTPLWTEHPEKLKGTSGEKGWITPEKVAEAMVSLIETDEYAAGSIVEVSVENRLVSEFMDSGPNFGPHGMELMANMGAINDDAIAILKKEAKS